MSAELVKHTYTKPIPAGARIVTRDDGTKFVRFHKRPKRRPGRGHASAAN
jgi:hypothetical protein